MSSISAKVDKGLDRADDVAKKVQDVASRVDKVGQAVGRGDIKGAIEEGKGAVRVGVASATQVAKDIKGGVTEIADDTRRAIERGKEVRAKATG